MPKNYYVILGIPANSTLNDVKNAYRRLAKEYHPDHYAHGRAPFLAIQEAYTVLSDPSRRREYDRNLENVRIHVRPTEKEPSGNFREEEAEPLVPDERRGESFRYGEARDLLSQTSGFSSLFDHFFDIASENWDYSRVAKENLEMEVTMNREQAKRGGYIRLKIPAQLRCPDCRGRGSSRFHECWRCLGTGYLQGEIPLMLNYPPGIRHNHSVTFSLARYGIAGKHLTVRFNIDRQRQ